MTRIEPSSSSSSSPSSLTKSHTGVRRLFRGFLFIITLPFKISLRGIVFFLLVLIFVLVLLTGIWHVPIASNIVYREPTPIRMVEGSAFSDTLFSLQTSEQLKSSAFGTIRVDLSEAQVQSLLQDTIAKNSSFPFTSYQIAIEKSHIEFYGKVKNRPQVVIRAHLVPQVQQGNLELLITKVYVGQLPILKEFVPASLLNAFTPSLISGILSFASLESVELEQQHLLLTFSAL